MTKGFSNWKNSAVAFKNHESSSCHREAVEMVITLPPTTTQIGVHISKEYEKEMAENRKALLKILSSIRYLAKQGLALRRKDGSGNFDQLLMLLSEVEDGSNLSQ